MNYTRHIYLDVNVTSAATVVKAKEGDRSLRFINVTLLKDGEQVTPDNGATAIFRLEKSDGHAVVNNATIESDGTITVELTAQCTAAHGKCKADILIVVGEETISSAVFILEVVKSPDVSNQLNSSDEFGALTDVIARAEDVVDKGEIKSFEIQLGTTWSGSSSPYSQTITLPGYSPSANTRVDLTCDADNINKMITDGVDRIYVVNNNGVLTAYATNNKPTTSITVQAVATEQYIM